MFKDKIYKILNKSSVGDRYEIEVKYYDEFGSVDNIRVYNIEVVILGNEKFFKLLGKNLLIANISEKFFRNNKEFKNLFLYDVKITNIAL